MANILDILSKTIEEVQRKNEMDPTIETADPSIFDLLRKEVNKIDNKVKSKQSSKGKSPKSIFDMIKDGIEGVQRKNRKDPNVQTAPKSVFKDILRKIEKKPQKQAVSGLKKVVMEYNLNINKLPQNVLNQVNKRYYEDLKRLNHQYAAALNDMIKRTR